MISFEGLASEVVQALCTPMHQILPPHPSATGALYLGSFQAGSDTALLHAHHISVLVQVLDVPWLPLSERDGFMCHRMDILDLPSQDLAPYLEGACRCIDDALRNGKNVLVHCQQGISRSPAIVIAYLIRNRGMSFDHAFAYVKHQRACINPNPGFIRCLQEFEAKGLLNKA